MHVVSALTSASPPQAHASAMRHALAQAEAQEARQHAPATPGKPRAGNVQFRVGDVVRHKEYGYRAVVYEWDMSCQADDNWQSATNVQMLPNGQWQPFYRCVCVCVQWHCCLLLACLAGLLCCHVGGMMWLCGGGSLTGMVPFMACPAAAAAAACACTPAQHAQQRSMRSELGVCMLLAQRRGAAAAVGMIGLMRMQRPAAACARIRQC
jgi:hypothetical protein